MTRKNYLPSFATVYLDKSTQDFLLNDLHLDLWKLFFNKIHHVFPNLVIHILVSAKLKVKLNDFKFLILYENLESEVDFLKSVCSQLPKSLFDDPDWDEVCLLYFRGISPLIDTELMIRAWDRHKNYFSQYSYSENLPEGIIPTIMTREFLSTLPDSLRTDVHSYFLKNINHYDVDIFFVPPDLRQYRFDFRVNEERNLNLVKRLLEKDLGIKYSDILPLLLENPNFFRFAPTYIEWEIHKGCKLACTFCPRQYMTLENDNSSFPLEKIDKTLKKFEVAFSSPLTICLGGNGEPLLHPEWKKIIKNILEYPRLQELIIETALYENTNEFIEFVSNLELAQKSKLCVIVNLSTLKEERYEKLYGVNFLKKILDSLDKLKLAVPLGSLHIQMIKMIDVADEIDEYFTYFEKRGINVILQKFNSFAGKIPERRVSDLTPIRREFCWHLNRDLYINVNGSVSICKQNQPEVIGNILTEDMGKIWENGMVHFSNTFLGKHSDIPAPCLKCDEWYTFNA